MPMIEWCPRCKSFVELIKHEYHNAKGKLIREEYKCNNCHSTLSVKHIEENTKEHREMHPLESFPELKIKRQNGTTIRVHALGTAQLQPAIDFACQSTTPAGRIQNSYICLLSSEFALLLNYLQRASEYWQADREIMAYSKGVNLGNIFRQAYELIKSKPASQMTDAESDTVATAITSLGVIIKYKGHSPSLSGLDLDNMPISEALLKLAGLYHQEYIERKG